MMDTTPWRDRRTWQAAGAALVLLVVVACGGKQADGSAAAPTMPPDGGLAGKLLYKQNCVRCHGINGDKCLYGARNLQVSPLGLEARMATIRLGRGKMPAFAPRLTPEQIEQIARYSLTLGKGKHGQPESGSQ